MKKRTLRLLVVAPLVLGAGLGCVSIIGADFSGQRLEVCNPATFPPPPKVTGAGSGPDFILVTSSVDLGEYDRPDGAPGYATIGYSLDGLCNRDQACAPPAWTGAHPKKGLDGRDNGLGELMHGQIQFFSQLVFNSDTLSANLKSGTNAPMLVLKVSGYSGFVDDDEIEVTLYVASPQKPDGTPFIPKWDHNDEWPLAALPGGAVGADASADGGALIPATYVDKHAYVSNYTLTAHLPKGATLRFSNVAFTTDGLVVTGQIDPASKTISHGLISGRMGISEMFRHVPEVTQVLLSQTLCIDNSNYGRIKTYFCSFTDVREDVNATGDCDGLSIGVGFETTQAKLGPVVVPTPVPGCAPEKSTENDTCANPPPPPPSSP